MGGDEVIGHLRRNIGLVEAFPIRHMTADAPALRVDRAWLAVAGSQPSVCVLLATVATQTGALVDNEVLLKRLVRIMASDARESSVRLGETTAGEHAFRLETQHPSFRR